MAEVTKIQHKGKEILYIDYRGCQNDDELIALLKQAQATIINDNKEYLQLTNVQNTYLSYNYMNTAKQVAKETPKLAKKRAIVGVDSPARKILLKGYNLVVGNEGLNPFDSEEEAKDWLVK
jgi:hypothetical protein